MPFETIGASISNNVSALDLQTDIILDVGGEAKINKFLDYIDSLVIGRNLVEIQAIAVQNVSNHKEYFMSYLCVNMF